MPRKQRIEYPGAIYHVISRGNYRKELFLRQNTGEAFERCLFEVVDRGQIAKELRSKTTAGNPWIALRLNMGHPSRVTNLIRENQA